MKKLAALSLAAVLFSGVALAEDAQKDPAASGHDFAVKVCGNCHGVDKGQTPILKPPAPSFASLLGRREIDEAWLRRFLATPHGNLGRSRKMPNPMLAEFQIDEIIAYFNELRAKHKAR
jgi:mono/diheme cytochrome c family protein